MWATAENGGTSLRESNPRSLRLKPLDSKIIVLEETRLRICLVPLGNAPAVVEIVLQRSDEVGPCLPFVHFELEGIDVIHGLASVRIVQFVHRARSWSRVRWA